MTQSDGKAAGCAALQRYCAATPAVELVQNMLPIERCRTRHASGNLASCSSRSELLLWQSANQNSGVITSCVAPLNRCGQIYISTANDYSRSYSCFPSNPSYFNTEIYYWLIHVYVYSSESSAANIDKDRAGPERDFAKLMDTCEDCCGVRALLLPKDIDNGLSSGACGGGGGTR